MKQCKLISIFAQITVFCKYDFFSLLLDFITIICLFLLVLQLQKRIEKKELTVVSQVQLLCEYKVL